MSICQHSRITFRKATASGNNDNGPNCVEVGEFVKAQASNPSGNCVEVASAKATASGKTSNCVTVGQARKAQASGAAGHCVTVAEAGPADHGTSCTPETCKTPDIQPGDIVVRDSKLGDSSPYVVFTPVAWRGYVATVIESGMERGATAGEYLLRDPRHSGNILHFTPGEADAFRDGCTRGEFNYQYAETAAA